MAETAINAVLSKCGELATREATVLLHVGSDIMELRDQLEWLQAFIRDTDRKRRAGTVDGLTRVWVRQTRNAAFDAEDALDEFFHKVDLQSQGEERWLRYLTSWWTQITVRHRLSGQIKSIRSRLDKISDNRNQYNIVHEPSRIRPSSAAAHSPRDDAEIKMEGYIGNEVRRLVKMLDDEDVGEKGKDVNCDDGDVGEKILISVVGESGSGKNTLVDAVYKLKTKEKVRIWYNMPPDSSTQDVLKQVYTRAYKKIKKTAADDASEEEPIDMAPKLRELLHGKKYLVVLSGISSKTLLNNLWASLPDNKNGSRVVLILESGDYDVARHGADTLNKKKEEDTILWLSRWDEERSARLFHAMVKVPGGEAVGKEDNKQNVYAITEGRPLAIALLAGLLRHKEPVEREDLLNQLKQNPNRIPAIERILSACYDDLPHDLKSCFLYLAAYPKNITPPADQIVRMWTAEGFIRPRKGKTPEELGRMYLDELVSRSLVTRNPAVQVHARVLEFLQSEARQANFIEVHDRCDVLEPAVVRRLSIQDDGNGYTTSSTCFPMLRSFLCRVEQGGGRAGSSSSSTSWSSMLATCLGLGGGRHGIDFICGSTYLHVLSVQGLGLEELPDEIGDMIHLRYVRVSCDRLKNLPSSIWKLLNLETLDITTTRVEAIDQRFWTIKALRHVLAEKLTLPPASLLTEELGDLQTLHGVKPAELWATLEDCPLHKMTKLRSLELCGLDSRGYGHALADALSRMHLLGHLKLQGKVIPSCVFAALCKVTCLHTMVLQAETIEWAHILHDWNVRPNLVQLRLRDISKVPHTIQRSLKTILVQDKNLT